MKHLLLIGALLLASLPFVSTAQALVATNARDALNNASQGTQDVVLQARIKSLTVALNAVITAIDKLNANFQANEKIVAEDKATMQQLTDKITQELNQQIDAISNAQSNAELDQIRTDAINELKSYEEQIKQLLNDAATRAFAAMITEAEAVLTQMEKLLPVLKAAGVDTTELQQQIDTCQSDIETANAAFDKAMNTKDPADIKAATQAIATLSRDLATLVQTANELAQ